VTHDQSEATALSDRVAVMFGGEVRQFATPVELYRNPVDQLKYDALAIVRVLKALVTPDEARRQRRGRVGALHARGRPA